MQIQPQSPFAAPGPANAETSDRSIPKKPRGEVSGGAKKAPATDMTSIDRNVVPRTRMTPGTVRIFTDIVDPTTREVLYRIPPQSIGPSELRESEASSRYERLQHRARPGNSLLA